MPFVGLKKGALTQYYIPDRFRMTWIGQGHVIQRRARPEDGDPAVITKILPLLQSKATLKPKEPERPRLEVPALTDAPKTLEPEPPALAPLPFDGEPEPLERVNPADLFEDRVHTDLPASRPGRSGRPRRGV